MVDRMDGILVFFTPSRFKASPIAFSAIGVWVLTFFPGMWSGVAPWFIRVACAVLWVLLARVFFHAPAGRSALASPLFAIATLALWLYAVIPALCGTFILGARTSEWAQLLISLTLPDLFPRFIDSEGELSVLRFSLIGIAVSGWLSSAKPSEARTEQGDCGSDLFPQWIVLALGLIAATIYVSQYLTRTYALGSLWSGLHRQAGFAALALFLTAYALTVLQYLAAKGRPILPLAFLTMLAIGPAMFGGLKTIFFVLGIVGLAIASARRTVWLLAAAAVVALTVLVSGMIIRHYYLISTYGTAESAMRVAYMKLIVRQVESVDCLTGVLRAELGSQPKLENPFYFAGGLAPRVLWPGKPDLSMSGKTVLQYCHPILTTNVDTPHSGSGTLLWEPLAFAGVKGQIVAQTLTFLILIVLSRIWITGGPYAAVGALALTPWTIDFDQHFALYIANLAKAGLVVSAALLLLKWISRRHQG